MWTNSEQFVGQSVGLKRDFPQMSVAVTGVLHSRRKKRGCHNDFTEQGGQKFELADTGQIDDGRGVADDHSEHAQFL